MKILEYQNKTELKIEYFNLNKQQTFDVVYWQYVA